MSSLVTIGRYEIKSELGRGGMSTVYLARDPRFGRDVALKVMSQAYREDVAFRGRFEREARTIATLEHPAIVPVYDFGEDGEQLYLVMRYMPGGTLSDRIVAGPLSLEESVHILLRIGAALDHAHRQGVIHRDLKPGNILFDQYNNAFLSDFGIVKLSEGTSTNLTGSGVIGTPAYMSPEQIHGELALDGRSDIYTLGIILFEMLTGRKPYRADTPVKQMMAHVLEPIPSILSLKPDLPPSCEEIVRKALAKVREERYQTATELTKALTAATGIQLTADVTTPPPMRPTPPPPATVDPEPDDSPTETAVLAEPEDVDAPADEATVTAGEPTSVPSAGRYSDAEGLSGDEYDEDEERRLPWLWIMAGAIALLLLIGSFTLLPDLDLEPEPTAAPIIADLPTETFTPTPTATSTPTETPEPDPTATRTPRATGTVTPFPTPAQFEYGRSVQDEPLTALRIGAGSKVAMFVGGLHAGWAPSSVTIAEGAAAYFAENLDQIPEDISLVIIFNANPDSPRAPGQLSGRLNANGVDPNRNWDCRWTTDPLPPGSSTPEPGMGGAAPFSEPEVENLVSLIESLEARAVVFWQARAVNGLVSPGACSDITQVSERLAQVYGEVADYRVSDYEILENQPVQGDATNWLDGQGIPAISVLLPEYATLSEEALDDNIAGMQAVLQWVDSGE